MAVEFRNYNDTIQGYHGFEMMKILKCNVKQLNLSFLENYEKISPSLFLNLLTEKQIISSLSIFDMRKIVEKFVIGNSSDRIFLDRLWRIIQKISRRAGDFSYYRDLIEKLVELNGGYFNIYVIQEIFCNYYMPMECEFILYYFNIYEPEQLLNKNNRKRIYKKFLYKADEKQMQDFLYHFNRFDKKANKKMIKYDVCFRIFTKNYNLKRFSKDTRYRIYRQHTKYFFCKIVYLWKPHALPITLKRLYFE